MRLIMPGSHREESKKERMSVGLGPCLGKQHLLLPDDFLEQSSNAMIHIIVPGFILPSDASMLQSVTCISAYLMQGRAASWL